MISTITLFPFLIVTAADSQLRDFWELLAAARAKPGSTTYGTVGVDTTHHLAGELLSRMTKVQMVHVPYRGDAVSITGLLTGDVPWIIAPPAAVMGNIKADKLRAITTTGPQRWPGLPDVPTIAEQGVDGFDVRSWAALMAPAGTPRLVVERLNVVTLKALEVPEVR